jgi:hypothetical protein
MVMIGISILIALAGTKGGSKPAFLLLLLRRLVLVV